MEIISATKKVCLIRKLSHHPKYLKLSGKFWHIQGFFWIIKNIQDYPETFQTTRKLSRLSENFPGYLETFQTIWKYPDYLETFRMAMPWCHDGFWASERLKKVIQTDGIPFYIRGNQLIVIWMTSSGIWAVGPQQGRPRSGGESVWCNLCRRGRSTWVLHFALSNPQNTFKDKAHFEPRLYNIHNKHTQIFPNSVTDKASR